MRNTPVLEISARPTRLGSNAGTAVSQNGFSRFVSKGHDLVSCGENWWTGGAQVAFTKTFQTTPIARSRDSGLDCSKHAPNRIQHLVKEGAAPLTSILERICDGLCDLEERATFSFTPLIRSI